MLVPLASFENAVPAFQHQAKNVSLLELQSFDVPNEKPSESKAVMS